MTFSNCSVAKVLLDQLMQVLGKYDIQRAIDRNMRMYVGGDTDIVWFPIGKSRT